jgi:hypothetical protein
VGRGGHVVLGHHAGGVHEEGRWDATRRPRELRGHRGRASAHRAHGIDVSGAEAPEVEPARLVE